MRDLNPRFEKLLIQAEDCDLIARLAPDTKKRELFAKLATDLRAMAHDVRARMAEQPDNDLPDESTQNPARGEVGSLNIEPLSDEQQRRPSATRVRLSGGGEAKGPVKD
jgi:hypothetical protein